MRQPLSRIVLALCVVLAAPARGDGPPAAGEPPAIARARQRIQAGDRQAAVNLLEDALIDGPGGEKAAIAAFLRRTYEEMAREAEAAGHAEVAARYRDNLAILQGVHDAPRPAPAARPHGEPPRPRLEPEKSRARPAPATVRPSPPETSGSTTPEAIQAPQAGVEPPSLSIPPELRAPRPDSSPSEPVPLPEPAKLPTPGPALEVPPPAAPPTVTRLPRSNPMTGPAGRPGEPAGRGGSMEPQRVIGAPGPAPPGAGTSPATSRDPAAGMATVTAAGSPDLATADQFFRAQNFDESGRIYASLAARNLLPADRRPHWAYCRFKAVVRRINAGPRSAKEWDAVEAEVRSIQRLTPGNWYGEYLINKVAEARRSRRRRGSTDDGIVVRGSSPEDSAPPVQPLAQVPGRRRPALLGGPSGPPAPPAAPAAVAAPAAAGEPSLHLPVDLSLPEATPGDPGPARPPAEAAGGGPGAGDGGGVSWQVHESANFRVHHCDPALAERAAAIAESVRTAQARRWGSTATRAAWSPRCELYLYPTARSYAEATGQSEISPGVSTMSNNGVRVLSRCMSLRADNPLLLTATLPHEVTHIVLADLFVAQAIPRWADEGLAVLAEPESERRHRQDDLKGPLDAGRVFEAGPLMAMDYPDPQDWRLFYAQSVSLTQYLVEQGPPERFIRFVRDTQRIGTEAALRDVYQIEGLAALQGRWLEYARKQASVAVASSRDAGTGPAEVRAD